MRIAQHVYTDQADIDRLQAMIPELPNGQPVALAMRDGTRLAGIVAVRPTIQQFFGPDGQEGSNALVRLEQPALVRPEAAGWVDVFLDEIVGIRHLEREDLLPLRHADTGEPAGSRLPPGGISGH